MYECNIKCFEQGFNIVAAANQSLFFSIQQMNPSHVVSLTILENWYG
jgi:hypothetical protein